MGKKAYKDFVNAIQAQISTFNSTVDLVEQRIKTLTVRAQGEGEATRKAAGELEASRKQLVDTQVAIVELKQLFLKVNNEWAKPANRVIGHVVWSVSLPLLTTTSWTLPLSCSMRKGSCQTSMGTCLTWVRTCLSQ
jgi:hypothetical protein